ncbi:MAG: hypothetical protein J4432_00245 [DPANN group archaeon]|nr:hypothetical protein [DPANN group archaeon]
MSKLAYCDTCIYIDYLAERARRNEAYSFFAKELSCKYNLVVSDWTLLF